jgi:protein-tyrosine kinase
MSRFAEALKRARTGSPGAAPGDDHRAGDAIRLFAPGQPAVVSPWDIEEYDETAPADLFNGTFGQGRPAARLADPVPDPAQEARPVAHDTRASAPSLEPVAREQYNHLAATIHHLQLERRLKVVMITSATSHEGKTATAANLATALSESYQRRVLLIDADLRHPSLHTMFGVANGRGLSDALAEWGSPPIVPVTPRLALLTAGSGSDDPIRRLMTDRMRLLMEGARAEFDCVLVDTAPIGLLPDAGLIRSLADGTVFVVRAGSTPRDVVQRAARAIGVQHIIGVVLSGIDKQDLVGGHNYYRDYLKE